MQDNITSTGNETSKKAKLLPSWLVTLLFAASFVLAHFISTRNIMYAMTMMMGISAVSSVNFLFYVFVGAAYWGIFELILIVAFRFLRINLALRREYSYYARLVGIGANILIFGIRLLYFAAPFMQFFIEAVFVTIITVAAFFLFVYILLKKNVMPDMLKGPHIKMMANVYLGFTLLMTVFNILFSVMQ